MKECLSIIQKELPSITEDDLFVPIEETHIDNIDIVVIRVALEKYFKHEVPDAVWYGFQSLSEGIRYFKSVRKISGSQVPPSRVDLRESIEIRMPQMANSALSENWLLKQLGDMHWYLLTKGLEQKSSQFKDEMGNRLYATFIRIRYDLTPLNRFNENDTIDFTGVIEAFGSHTYLSNVSGLSGANKIEATLMTTFTSREQGNNTNLVKAAPLAKTNRIPTLSQTPLFLNDYRLLRKDLLEDYSCCYGNFSFNDEEIFRCEYIINPYYEINGVGLLYFASYPVIFDKCTNDSCRQQRPSINLFDDYYTVFRDVFYFANCNCNDTIVFSLQNIFQEDSLLKTVGSLYRKSDNQRLATIVTVKERVTS